MKVSVEYGKGYKFNLIFQFLCDLFAQYKIVPVHLL